MIDSKRIKSTLKFLDIEYNTHLLHSKNSEIPVLYAKMALLEYCGWLEQTFDEIARNCIQRKPRTSAPQKLLEEKIKTTYGLRYSQNVRPLLAYGLGVLRLSEVEKKLDATGDLTLLKSHLGTISKKRNEAAHTFIAGTTRSFDEPSTTIAYLNEHEPRLRKLWELVCEE